MPEGHKVVTKTLSMFRDSHKTNTSQSDSLTQLSRVYQVSPIQPAVIAFTQAHLQAASFNTTIGILALRLENIDRVGYSERECPKNLIHQIYVNTFH